MLVYFKCFRILVCKLVLKRNLYAHFLSLHLSKSPSSLKLCFLLELRDSQSSVLSEMSQIQLMSQGGMVQFLIARPAVPLIT